MHRIIPALTLVASSALTALSPAAASAETACAAEIDALFHGGAWDPFARPNRREVSVARHPDGSETLMGEVLWDGPLKSINCTLNGCFMAIGAETWTGASAEGPWAAAGNTGIADPEAFVRATNAQLAASVSEPECLSDAGGEGSGAEMLVYRFMSKPDPNEFGSWWGGRYQVEVDAESGRLLRIELSEGIASWAPEPSADVQVTTISYDDTISITRPEE